MRQAMPHLLLITQKNNTLTDIYACLVKNDFVCSTTTQGEEITELILHQSPDLILIEVNNHLPIYQTLDIIHRIKEESPPPIIALVNKELLDSIDGNSDVDDFLSSPFDTKELVLRIKRLLQKPNMNSSDEVIRCDGLLIDLARCEVTVESKVVALTFKEYELLKFLASNRGRVFTREVLLNRIWGYDYYGGDRTVDVHIRRLRSKIENPTHDYIETVRNIGYRFKKYIKPLSVCNIDLTLLKYNGNNNGLV
jgi:DNA-binding response OmpR family regulator